MSPLRSSPAPTIQELVDLLERLEKRLGTVETQLTERRVQLKQQGVVWPGALQEATATCTGFTNRQANAYLAIGITGDTIQLCEITSSTTTEVTFRVWSVLGAPPAGHVTNILVFGFQ